MKPISISAGLLAAGLWASVPLSAQADTLNEGFDNLTALISTGWILTNASFPAGQPWFQGNSGIFAAQAGADDSYVAVNFNSTTAVSGSVDNWLISPVMTIDAGSILSFYTQASDAGFMDLLEVRFSSGSGADVSGFSTLLAQVGSAATANYPVGAWTLVTAAMPVTGSGRIAFHYSVADASNASYIGIDTLSVGAVPEPATLGLLGLGLGFVNIARRRARRASQPEGGLQS